MKLMLQLLLSSLLISLSLQKGLYKWKYIDYDWIDSNQEKYYCENGLYKKIASTPIDALIANDKVFITIPRSPGVPASIGTLNKSKIRGGGPVVKPYPDWGWSDIRKNCNETIVSVYRVDIDDCDRLWVLDNGKNGDVTVCPQKLIAFDLKTDKVVLIKEIPSKYGANSNGTGVLVTPLVITHGKECHRITVYMADIEGYGLVIWRGDNHFQRFESPAFAKDPKTSNFNLDNDKFSLNDGVVGLAMHIADPSIKCKTLFCNDLYFSALTSYNMYHVSVNSLKNSNSKNLEIIKDKGNLHFRKVSLVIKHHSMYFSTLEDYSLRKWDVRTKFTNENAKIIRQDKSLLNFVSGLKIIKNNSHNDANCTQIYGLSNKYERTAANKRNINEINYNIFLYDLCGKDASHY